MKEKASILVIDNSCDFTRAAKIALEKTGRYIVAEENDSRKAHQTALDFQPDLILLDIAMPETDGGEVAAWIQSDPGLHRIPIVFLTALVTIAEARSGLRIHGHPFLAKPIRLPELIKGIEENLPATFRTKTGRRIGIAASFGSPCRDGDQPSSDILWPSRTKARLSELPQKRH